MSGRAATRQRPQGRQAPRRRQAPLEVFAATWTRQAWPLRILRAFLGITFLYAGVQKLSDPGYLHAGSPTDIVTQLQAFSRGSPIGPLLSLLAHFGVLVGIGTALLEIAIGVGTLLAIAPVAFAALGLGINVVLWLSASWHVHPYFLGSDSMYAVGWAALLVGLVEERRRYERARAGAGARRRGAQTSDGRREFLRGALVAVGSVVIGMVASALRGPLPASAAPPLPTGSTGTPGSGSGSPGPGTSSPGGASTGSGTRIAKLDSVPVGGAIGFNDRTQGPAVLVRLGQEQVVAYSRTCTHAGCPVGYDSSARLLVCPCHGAEFDPAHGARVVAGPAPAPLPSIPVALHGGEVYVES